MTGNRKVLVVDDNEDAAIALSMLLQAMGYQTAEAYDGEQALEVAESFRPDLILLDLGLPGLDGYEVARRLRDAMGSVPRLVALTGWGQEEARLRTADAGFDEHLVKPVDAETLSKVLGG